MSLKFISEFNTSIYNLLANDELIKQNISHIYFVMAQNSHHPFILINLLNINDLSKFNYYIYEINFEICIFARDKRSILLLKLADQINDLLTNKSNFINHYTVTSIKNNIINFQPSLDMVTNKINLNYYTLIKNI